MEDKKIIDLYWARNESAIAETQTKYGAFLSGISRRILHYQEDVEECVNDTYLGAWNAMPPERPLVLSAFLAKITRNLSLKKYRAGKALKRGQGEVPLFYDELAECLTDGRQIDEHLQAELLAGIINRFLSNLKKTERQIFVSRYFYFFPVNEIAKKYGFGESKVKMSLKRSRDRLKEELEKEDIWL